MNRIKCGRCGTEFAPPQATLGLGPMEECKCPLCGFSKKDVQETVKSEKKVLNG
jgi:DNA-directed RNA polymerase subunit RPC12/RpoP